MNLVYYSFNSLFWECARYNIDLLKKKTPNVDVCCIIPNELANKFTDVKTFIVDNLDCSKTHKYLIAHWKDFDKYENFLYLDSDSFPVKDVTPIFKIIEKDPTHIHGVIEKPSINTRDPFFRIYPDKIVKENYAFNAGQFGFNKSQKHNLLELIELINNVEYPRHLSEQPHFNELFAATKQNIKPTLSNFVFLGKKDQDTYLDINKITMEQALIIHPLGGFGDVSGGTNKLSYIKTIIETKNLFDFKTREDFLLKYPKNSIGAEIGVFEGEFSEKILKQVNPKGFYMVDIFTGEMCSGDKNGDNMKYLNLDSVYETLQEKYQNTNNVQIFKGKSESFFNTLPDNYLDFIYIDGDHSYNGAKSDLFKAYTKIKNNGIITGHDYTDRFPGVKQAVNEFCDYYNLQKHLTSNDGCPSYFIVKNN